jgi:hypothetical protein
LVDESRQKIRDELFASGRREELIQALIAPAPEIATSGNVTAVNEDADEVEESEPEESDA